jgi:hypothetical protein
MLTGIKHVKYIIHNIPSKYNNTTYNNNRKYIMKLQYEEFEISLSLKRKK